MPKIKHGRKKADVKSLIEEFVKLENKIDSVEQNSNKRIDELIENTKRRLDEIQALMEQRLTDNDTLLTKFYERLLKAAASEKQLNPTMETPKEGIKTETPNLSPASS
jgi:DNA-binding protein H-NS